MINESFSPQRVDEVQKEVTQLPEDAPALADWIEAELGDTELAAFLRAHSTDAPLLLNGGRAFPANAYELLKDMGAKGAPGLHDLAQIMFDHEFFPEVTTSKIVGNAPKKGWVIDRQRYIAALEKLSLHDDEREKTKEDSVILSRSVRSINGLRAQYGLQPLAVSPDAVHMIDRFSVRTNDRESAGIFFNYEQSVAVGTWKSPALRIGTAYHELLHFASYFALQTDYDKSEDVVGRSSYRMGLQVVSRQNRNEEPQTYLKNLNEAVTEETARRFMLARSQDDPELGYAVREREERVGRYFQEYAEHAHEFGYTQEEVLDIETKEDGTAFVAPFGYREERQMMFSMFDKLYEKNPEHFEGKTQEGVREELFVMLQKAMFTGNILPFGRLFNDTFGRGKFREFGHLQTIDEQQAFVAALSL